MFDWNLLKWWIGVMLTLTSLVAVYEAWMHPRYLRATLGGVAAAAGIMLYAQIRGEYYTAAPGRPFPLGDDILAEFIIVVGLLFVVHVVVVGAIVRSVNREFAADVSLIQKWLQERVPKSGEDEMAVADFTEKLSALGWWIGVPRAGEEKMAVTIPGAVDTAIVDRFRQLARQGATVEQMVTEVRASLGFSPNSARDPLFIMPVQDYFCDAFSLELFDVEPLEQWVKTKDDRLIEELMLRIKEFRESKHYPRPRENRNHEAPSHG